MMRDLFAIYVKISKSSCLERERERERERDRETDSRQADIKYLIPVLI